MRAARGCLGPLRFGAGIIGKLVQAMQSGTRSVTTAIGAEAMHDQLPWSGVIEDATEAFAEQAVELYQNQQMWRSCQAKGIEIVKRCYNRDAIGQDLLERIETLRQQLPEHRLDNFNGAMLRHHSMKSVQYMSQWIEAKNRHKNHVDEA